MFHICIKTMSVSITILITESGLLVAYQLTMKRSGETRNTSN